MWIPLEHAPRYEFYSGKETKIAPKPFSRYDSSCATNPVTLLQHVPRYDPRSGAHPYNQLKIITWNIVLENKKLIWAMEGSDKVIDFAVFSGVKGIRC